MWSYPVIQDGLIYTVDLRNGLYILKYNGPYEQEVDNDQLPGGQLQPGRRAVLSSPSPAQTHVDCSTPTARAARAARCRRRCR